jgi:glycosyltransferase involved in cell wall biosynthesis
MFDLHGKHSIVSIILPFKNEELYLEACINSILNQTYPHWELVLVDDNSTDKSTLIAQDFVATDPRIQYFKSPGSGVIEAMRHGFLQSTGSLITRMDGDDLKAEDNLEQLIRVTRAGTIGIGKVKYFRDDGLGGGYSLYEAWINELTQADNNFGEVYKECVIPSPAWLATRQDFIAAGGFNSDFYPEDYDLCFRFYKAGLKTAGTSGIIHFWRDHANRTTRTSHFYADNRFMDLKLHYFKEIDHDKTKQLILWGAGKKGKVVAKDWTASDISFRWLTDNTKKIGHNIYGKILENAKEAVFDKNAQVVIVVADKAGQSEISALLDQHETAPVWFC